MEDISFWHKRYQQQAQWTTQIRKYLWHKAKIRKGALALDVGCGTGVLLAEVEAQAGRPPIGVDIQYQPLQWVKQKTQRLNLITADGHKLPFSQNYFDLVFCHFVLLWVKEPVVFLKELLRVTKPGGSILVLAEPDYQGRIDFPKAASILGKLQIEALQNQGANPYIGKQLPHLFHLAGIRLKEFGIIAGHWTKEELIQQASRETQVLLKDIADLPPDVTQQRLIREFELAAQDGYCVTFVPTCYAWGVKGNG